TTMRTVLRLARTFLAAFAFAAPLAFAVPFNADYRVSTLTGSSQNPRIAGEIGTSNLHLVWIEQTGDPTTSQLYYARSTNNGLSWETPKAITSSTATKMFPSVAAYSGNVIVVWNGDFYTGGVSYVRSANSGTTFSAETLLWDSTGYSRNPEIIADA